MNVLCDNCGKSTYTQYRKIKRGGIEIRCPYCRALNRMTNEKVKNETQKNTSTNVE